LQNRRVKVQKCEGYELISLPRPHVADRSLAAEHFKIAELAFRRFVNRDRMFVVKSVDLIFNPTTEASFHDLEQIYITRDNKTRDKSSLKETQIIEEWTSQQQRALKHIKESIYWCNDDEEDEGEENNQKSNRSDEPEGNPVLAWHGTSPENLPDICKKGFLNLSNRDTGWYGKGMYFTQMPNYGQFYINHCIGELGETFSLLLSWLMLGRIYPLDKKLDGGETCTPNFDSHVVLVDGFDPCPIHRQPTGDEIVVFTEAQVLPRYIVNYEVFKKAQFTPLFLLESSDEGEDEDGSDGKKEENTNNSK